MIKNTDRITQHLAISTSNTFTMKLVPAELIICGANGEEFELSTEAGVDSYASRFNIDPGDVDTLCCRTEALSGEFQTFGIGILRRVTHGFTLLNPSSDDESEYFRLNFQWVDTITAHLLDKLKHLKYYSIQEKEDILMRIEEGRVALYRTMLQVTNLRLGNMFLAYCYAKVSDISDKYVEMMSCGSAKTIKNYTA